jgi:hypothetical protein
VILAASSIVVAAGLVAWRAVVAPTSGNAGIVVAVGGSGALVLVPALIRFYSELIPWALCALTVAYGVGLPVHVGSTGEAAGYGVGMFVVAELAYASYDNVTQVKGEPGTRAPALVLALTVIVTSLLLDVVAVGSSHLATNSGLLLVTAIASVVLLFTLLTALVRGRRGDE